MDALARLLDAPRGRDAYLLRASLTPLVGAARRRVAVGIDSDRARLGLGPRRRRHPLEMRAGDVAVARGPAAVTVSYEPGVSPDVVILPGMRVESPEGRDVDDEWSLGLRAWGNDRDGATVMLMGCYQVRGEVTQRLLSALPPVIHVRAPAFDTPFISILASEIVRDAPGQSAVLDRLFDVLLVAVLRAWVTHAEPERAGLYGALSDRIIGHALRLLHDDPAYPWTIAELAARVRVSRAALALRFATLVGEPPMTYLTGWRLALAADRLLQPNVTIEAVAREVGYSTGFALSTAFKRERGMSRRSTGLGRSRHSRSTGESSPVSRALSRQRFAAIVRSREVRLVCTSVGKPLRWNRPSGPMQVPPGCSAPSPRKDGQGTHRRRLGAAASENLALQEVSRRCPWVAATPGCAAIETTSRFSAASRRCSS
ncbi:AraC family transcriptional regulator [Oerskovia sp. M15]